MNRISISSVDRETDAESPVFPKPIEFLRKDLDEEKKRAGNKREQIKEIVYESATGSTAHSIPHIFKRENRFLKFFWLLCLLAATGVCAWMVSLTIADYLTFETVSKTESVLEIPSTFPTVSFCNINPFVTNYSFSFVQDLLTKNGLYFPATNSSVRTK